MINNHNLNNSFKLIKKVKLVKFINNMLKNKNIININIFII